MSDRYSYELRHSFLKRKGWEKKDHKYIKKIKGKNGKDIYFYTKEELEAFGRGVKKNINDFKNDIHNKSEKKTYEKDLKKQGAKLSKDNKEFDKKAFEYSQRYKAQSDAVKKQTETTAYKIKLNKQSQAKRIERAQELKNDKFHKEQQKIRLDKKAREYKLMEQAKVDNQKSLVDPGWKAEEKGKKLLDMGYKKKTQKMTRDEDMRAVNPDYKKAEGSETNCASCSLNYYMRRNGFDTESNLEDDDWYDGTRGSARDSREMSEWFEKDHYKDWSDNKRINDEYENMTDHPKIRTYEEDTGDKYGDHVYDYNTISAMIVRGNKVTNYAIDTAKEFDGEIGFINMYWYGGGGHSIIWEKDGNDIIFRDCQTGKVMKNEEFREYGMQAYTVELFDPEGYHLSENSSEWSRNRRK